jgi:transcriptional regulator with XRE-family HTH domain
MPKHSSVQSVFARRLKEARLRAGIPQDRLGVMIGLDEGSSSARMSRYETGVHEPPFLIIAKIAKVLKVPVAYFFCGDDRLAEIMRIYFLAQEDARQAMLEAVTSLGG